MRILLADDSRAMRAMFRGVLEKLGHAPSSILEAPDGTATRTHFRQTDAPIDLAVVDWDLPGMYGPDFMQNVHDAGLSGKISVLFCVNRAQRAQLPQVARLGPCDAIERPFTEEAFEAKVKALGGIAESRLKASSRRMPAVSAATPPSTPVPSGLPFLMELPSAIIDDLLKLATPARHDAGVVVLRAGQVCGSLNLVTHGEVEILAGPAGGPIRVARDGDPYGELSFMTAQPSAETARTKSIVRTASLSKAQLAELLKRQPAMSKHLSALMDRHKKVMVARATTLEHSDFKGTFDTLPFTDVMQMLISTRKTGVLGLRGDQGGGAVYLENGEAIHAWADDLGLKGEEAFYALSGWRTAKFAFTSIRRTEPRTLHLPTITLLMKAMKRHEETPAPSPKASQDADMDALFGK
jgi:CRP-like cAMP-binding protein/FixJ family two-component response regulator